MMPTLFIWKQKYLPKVATPSIKYKVKEMEQAKCINLSSMLFKKLKIGETKKKKQLISPMKCTIHKIEMTKKQLC